MAFLGIGKNNKDKKVEVAAKPVEKKAVKKVVKSKVAKTAPVAEVKAVSVSDLLKLSDVILRPHITEKSGMLSQGNVYSFEVRQGATKGEIAEAVRRIYKVTPIKVSTARMMPKRRTLAGRPGFSANGKKAYVRLKEGDKIEFI